MAFDVSDALGPVDCIDELLPGTCLLNGQYRITRFLASGGFGITYLAKDGLDRDVVLKECFVEAFCKRSQSAVRTRSEAHRAHLQRAVSDFRREAQTLATLTHPNIVRVHQYFEENNTAYMALDYVAGHDLFEIVEEGRMTLTPDQIQALARKLVSAVAHLHDRGLVHCDISPDNIAVTPAGEPVLLDFGSARPLVNGIAEKQAGFTCVKDGYSPHEMYEEAGVCGRYSDIYALAATLYFAITGRAPADSATRLRALLADKPDPLHPLLGEVEGYAPGFLASIDRALSVEPAARFRHAQDWLLALARPEEAPAPKPATRPAAAGPAPTRDPVIRDRNVVLLRRLTVAQPPVRQLRGA